MHVVFLTHIIAAKDKELMEVWRKQEAEMSSRCVDRTMGVNQEVAPPRLETDKRGKD